jgi:hypothetical protein
VDDPRHWLVAAGVFVDPHADLQLRVCGALADGVGQFVIRSLRISSTAAAIGHGPAGSDSGIETVEILEILEQP